MTARWIGAIQPGGCWIGAIPGAGAVAVAFVVPRPLVVGQAIKRAAYY